MPGRSARAVLPDDDPTEEGRRASKGGGGTTRQCVHPAMSRTFCPALDEEVGGGANEYRR